MRHNLLEGLQKIMPSQLPRLAAVLDRDMNKADPHGKEEWDTIRDMDKVWRVFSKYDARNTILLDNEARKFCEHPDNGIVVPEFGPAEVQRRVSHTLSGVQAYLLELGRCEGLGQ
ncbi:FCP1 homology domain-containing protein, partial [Haematococcus lacustris]